MQCYWTHEVEAGSSDDTVSYYILHAVLLDAGAAQVSLCPITSSTHCYWTRAVEAHSPGVPVSYYFLYSLLLDTGGQGW